MQVMISRVIREASQDPNNQQRCTIFQNFECHSFILNYRIKCSTVNTLAGRVIFRLPDNAGG